MDKVLAYIKQKREFIHVIQSDGYSLKDYHNAIIWADDVLSDIENLIAIAEMERVFIPDEGDL